MEELYEAGNRGVKPDVITYNCVLDALAKSKDDSHASEKAERLLRRMKSKGVKPNARTMVSLLSRFGRR